METTTPIPNIKKKNPRENANPISALFFLYMIPTFIENYRKGVNRDDVFEPLKAHSSGTLGDKLEATWRDVSCKYEKYGLHVALFKLFGLELIIIAIIKLIIEVTVLIVMPMCVDVLVSYYEHESKSNVEETYIYGGVLIGMIFLDGIVEHQAMLAIMHTCMKMRVSCCSLIYRKSLRLSRTSLAQTTVGQVVNLLSNDVSKFDQTFVLYHYAFLGPLETMVGTYLLYRTLGVAAFAGIAFLLLFIPFQLYLCKRIAILRLRTAFRTDERVRLMNEILNGIQVIKMYTWEKPFAKLIDLARRHEIASIRSHFFLESIMFSLEMFITRTCLFISLIVFVAMGATMTADVAYTATTIYSFIRPVMTMLFSISIAAYAEVHISIKRVHSFLNHEEQSVIDSNVDNQSSLISFTPSIIMKEVSAKWVKNSSDNVLETINIDLHGTNLNAVVGSVGSGKSSILHLILGELCTTEGEMRVRGSISYASQEAWLFAASVKQNIIFCHEYDEERYKRVLKVCALEPDLSSLPYGDRTVVGEKGKSLSGGQKARINLARCIYKEADIYLLDDPLSAVDSNVGLHIFENCIRGFLKDKMCILVTHQLQFLSRADNIIVLEDGKIALEATFEKLQHSGLNFSKILEEDTHDGPEQQEKKHMSRQSSETSQIYEHFEDEDIKPLEHKEQLASGHIKSTVYWSYFKSGGNCFIVCFVALAFIANQVVTNGGDYFVSYWVNLEQRAVENNETINKDNIIYVYSGLTGATVIFAIGHNLLFFMYAMRASISIHNQVFQKISNAAMSFYNTNPIGRILNRFSKDIGIIDDYIPFILTDMIEIFLMLLGAVILSATVNAWFLLPSFALFLLFYFLRIIFLETSRSVKRIEGINRSPILTHLTASIYGLSTIRAFSAQKLLIQEYDSLQDNHSSAWYLFISASRAFGFWIEMVCNFFVAGIVFSLLLISKDYYGGDIGLVLTQYLGLMGALQFGMRQWSELENNMTSVERIMEFKKAQLEPMRESKESLPKLWPELGKIVFNHVSMSYAKDLPVLHNLNFTIQPGEKVGIVGRTGAGKTSTVAALFQLYEIEGSIIIDDIDTTKINLELLRSKISIIPQDPVLFKGTMRKNLDPFEEFHDDVIWNALEQVELKATVIDSAGGLAMNVWENGSNFSIGQRQLICLARAIVRNNKILVMDEATANVDPYTDGLIQKTIRNNFSHCTVITIAHRLHTIMDSDRVLVMEAGCAVEFDHPYNLLQDKQSVFSCMVETAGKNTARKLHCIAEESFLKMKNT